MSRSKPLMFIVIALILAVLAGLGAHRFIQAKAQAVAASRVTTAPVVVAARDMVAGVTLKAADLSLKQWPLPGLPKDRFARVEHLVGRVLDGPAVAGEAILKSKLVPKDRSGGLSTLVKPGMRAVTVGVDPVIGVAGFVQPGDRVDVVATVEIGKFADDPTSRIVLQDVEVLAVGENVDVPGQEKKKSTKPRQVKVVTLQMNPAQSQRLALAASKSHLLLTLRNQRDHVMTKAGHIHMTHVFPLPPKPVQKAPVQVKPRVRKQEIEIIKGVTRSTGGRSKKDDRSGKGRQS